MTLFWCNSSGCRVERSSDQWSHRQHFRPSTGDATMRRLSTERIKDGHSDTVVLSQEFILSQWTEASRPKARWFPLLHHARPYYISSCRVRRSMCRQSCDIVYFTSTHTSVLATRPSARWIFTLVNTRWCHATTSLAQRKVTTWDWYIMSATSYR